MESSVSARTCALLATWLVGCSGEEPFQLGRDLGTLIGTMMSVTPLKAGARDWVPACAGDATHVALNFRLTTTPEHGGDDLQAYPEDRFHGARVAEVLTRSAPTLVLDCIEPHRGDAAPGECASDAPIIAAPATSAPLRYVDHRWLPAEREVGVTILVDQSGSTNGGVDAAGCQEAAPGTIPTLADPSVCASDPGGARLAATESLIRSLRADDRHRVLAFNETIGVQPICGAPGFHEPWDPNGLRGDEWTLQTQCYTTDERYSLGDPDDPAWPSALAGLDRKGSGRSNLWSALVEALGGEPVWTTNRQVVVFTDGPDTCHPDGPDFVAELDGEPQPTCDDAASFEEARAALGSTVLSFVHFSAPGHREADPRMQELACLSGGQYLFVNTASLDGDGDRQTAILGATRHVELSLRGYYSVVAEIPALTQPPAPGAALARGAVYALRGAAGLFGSESHGVMTFGWEPRPDLPSGTDLRLLVHRPCLADADCDGGTCEPQTRLCVSGD